VRNELGHALAAVAFVDLPARVARLAELQAGGAEAPDIAEPHIALVEFGRRQVLAHAADDQLAGGSGEAPGEAGVVGSGVEMHRLVRAAMHAAVGLLVADEAFRAEFERAVRRLLVHAGGAAGFRKRTDAANK